MNGASRSGDRVPLARRLALSRRRRTERGAVAVFMALVTCFVVLPVASYAVDIGMQRMARGDAQTLADAAAQDAARALGTGTTSVSALTAIAQATVNASRGMVGSDAPTVVVHTGNLSNTFVGDQSLGCGASPYNAYFTAAPVGATPTAVLVTISNRVDFSLVSGGGSVCRSAIARAYKTACMMMDSYAARLASGEGAVLGPITRILGTNIDLTALSSSGILSADLDVLNFLNILKTQLNVGTVDQLLTTQVTAAQVIAAQVEALTRSGTTGAAQANVLTSQIGAHVGPLLDRFTVGTLLGISQGGQAALGTTVNALDLATAAVQLANGTRPITIAATGQNLTGLSLGVTVGSKPTRVCLGDGKRTMEQIAVTATADINAPGTLTSGLTNLVNALNGLLSGVLGLLGTLLGTDTYDLPQVSLGKVSATISLGSASGTVNSLSCNGRTPTSMSVTQGASLAPATVRIPLIIRETRNYGGFLGIGRQHETVTSTLTIALTTVPSTEKTTAATLLVPGDYGKVKQGPNGDLSVGNVQINTTMQTDGQFSNGRPLVNQMLSSLNSVVNAVQTNLLGPLTTTIVNPLLTAVTNAVRAQLGLTIAGSTFTALPTPSCGTPALAG
ncbi:pilus assembly protein TadG-related protein [Nocardioides sp. R-C-SC26]|uniref:pilus assembly protein TadG-related protein n=1 Tax=Nocardioides sp. R-C-SC26 TaxID=2870414 RepID=UPI001E609039|nr:pilus assembly protein TadG-related protein [Nocardioides sp. R-C-SC26]